MKSENKLAWKKRRQSRLLLLQDNKCFLCGKKLTKDITLDHVIPVKLGGKGLHRNKVLMHAKCNRQKGSRPPTSVELNATNLLYHRNDLLVHLQI